MTIFFHNGGFIIVTKHFSPIIFGSDDGDIFISFNDGNRFHKYYTRYISRIEHNLKK